MRYTERQRYRVPKIVTEQRFVRNRQIEHRDPVYGWREEKRGTKIVNKIKTTRAWKPVNTEIKWKLEKNPTPTPTPTPKPPVTQEPERVETPELTGTPFPAVSIPMTDPNHLIPGLGVDAYKLYKKGKGIWDVSKLSYNPLDSGNYSVSAPGVAAGGKLVFRQKDQFIPGTYYTPGVLANATAKSLLWRSAKGLGISLVSSVGLNVYDYSIGEHADIGVKSNEFAASTAVDFLQAGLTGLAAAGVVAGTIAIIGAASATAVLSIPLVALAGITALVGMGINYAVNQFVDMDKVKQKVTAGFETFPGIIDNAKTIVTVGAERVGDAVNEAITSAVDTGRDAIESIVDTTQDIAHSVSDSVQAATKTITDFVGSLFGGD